MELFYQRATLIQCGVAIVLCLAVTDIQCIRSVQIRDNVVPQIYDLCGQHYNGRRIYLDSGRSGIITAKNVQILPPPLPVNENHLQSVRVNGETAGVLKEWAPNECTIELVACPNCVIEWKVLTSKIAFPEDGCVDFIELNEPPHGPRTRICTQKALGKSETRNVLIRFVFSQNYDFAFEMQIDVKRNRINITEGLDGDDAVPVQRHISTPFFPMHYPRDYEVEYSLRCGTGGGGGGHNECQVHVNFIDFHLAPVSVLEIIDYQAERVEIFTGLSLRPRIFKSSGNSLLIRFSANGGIGTGFNANIHFIPANYSDNPIWKPETDCGGYVDRLGGAITMMKMTNSDLEHRYFDCIWIIRPSNKYYHMKTHQSLQLASFSVLPHSQLTIRRGVNSLGELLGTYSEAMMEATDSFETTITDGFYIQMKGNFTQNSTLALVYTVFSQHDCYMGSDFMCANSRCIPVQVHCDGFDHCGDGSDEPPSCAAEWVNEPFDRQWYKFIPNYYFPGTEYDLKTASILFIGTSAGLILLLACLFLVLYRINMKARQQRELQNHLQTISELLDHSNRHQVEPEDEPPIYEAPPEYEEVIKVGIEQQDVRRSKRRNSEQHQRRRRSKQPILDTETDEGHATPAFVTQHAILTEPFPIGLSELTRSNIAETPGTSAEAEETAAGSVRELLLHQEEAVAEEDDHEIIEAEGLVALKAPPTANGFLIVFQNDQPTAVPVHEFIPFDDRAKVPCLQCENHNNQPRANEFANRMVRRFSADPLLPNHNTPTHPPADVTRSFRV